MSYAWQIQCLDDRLRLLELEIGRIANKDHPFPEPDSIYRALLQVVGVRRELLSSWKQMIAVDENVEDLTRSAIESSMDGIGLELLKVAQILQMTRRVDSSRIPFEVLNSLSWVAEGMLKKRCRTVVRLDPDLNYSISSVEEIFAKAGFAEEWLATLADERREPEQGMKEGGKIVLLFGFPSSAARSILLHALAAHELGHIVIESIGESLQEVQLHALTEVKSQRGTALTEYIESSVVKPPGASMDDAYEATRRRVESRLWRIASNWTKEVLADLIAVRLVGPAFFAAFDMITVDFSCNDEHPPVSLRRFLGRKYLGMGLENDGLDPVWEQVFEGRSNGVTSRDLLLQLGEEICVTSLGKLGALADRTPSPLEHASLPEILEEVFDHIEHLVPPNVFLVERYGSVDWEAFWIILHAAWKFRLDQARFNRFCDVHGWGASPSRGEEALGNIILHALKSLELRHRWAEQT